jgi:signal transduction histidine kinase
MGVVSVADTGIGIPAADLQKVFEMFSQVRSHRGHADGGVGIGLSLVRQLVEMHGGSVQATSPGEGRGSTFFVRLPLIDPAPAA